jgi:DCN1-like protein 1/2
VENQKSLSLETAIAFWDLLMTGRFKYLEEWKSFLIENHGKAISRDTWNLFWDFATNFTDFSSHDTDGTLSFT